MYNITKDNNFNKNIILPLDKTNKLSMKSGETAVIVHLYYLDTVDIYLDYVKNVPEEIDIFFTVSSSEVKCKIEKYINCTSQNCFIIPKENRGRDISAFLVACREKILQYKYICFLHDKKEKHEFYKKDMECWIECLWENLLGSREFIYNILETFEERTDLGVLSPPFPLTDHFSVSYENAWAGNIDMTQRLLDDMGVNLTLDKKQSPITLGTVFWARTAALKKLLERNWSYYDFDEEPLKADGTISHAIERSLAFFAEDAGYKTKNVMNSQYAEKYMEYMGNVIKKAFEVMNSSLGIKYVSELSFFEKRRTELLRFMKINKQVYIYGAGLFGQNCLCLLRSEKMDVSGFLVSSKENNLNIVQGIPVYSISEISLQENSGIIVAVSEIYQAEILQKIKEEHQGKVNIFVYGEAFSEAN